MPGLDPKELARHAGATVQTVMRISEAFEATASKAGCPLTDRQILILRAQLMLWVPKIEDAAVREFGNYVDAALKKNGG